MTWTVGLAATAPDGGVLTVMEAEVDADTVEDAYDKAMTLQDWTPENGGFLVSRLTSDTGDDRLVFHDNSDPRKCWLS